MIVDDMNALEKEKGVNFDKFSFVGPYYIQCRELLLAKKGKPIYERMVYCWFQTSITRYRMKPVEWVTTIKKDDIRFKTPVRSNEFYKMYIVDDKIVVAFEHR